jgi:hypothetical protein
VRRDPAGLALRRRLDSTKPRAVQSLQDSRGASQPGFEPERRIPLHLPLVSPRSVRFTPQPWLLVTCRCHHGTGSRRPPSGCVPTGTGTSGSIACRTMSFTSLSSARMMVGDLHLVVGLGRTRHQNRDNTTIGGWPNATGRARSEPDLPIRAASSRWHSSPSADFDEEWRLLREADGSSPRREWPPMLQLGRGACRRSKWQ